MRLGGWAKSIKGRKTAFTVTFRSNLFVKKKKKEIVAKMKEKNMRFTWIVPLDYSYKIRYGKNMFMIFYNFFFDFLGIMSNKYGVRVTVAFGKNLTTNIAFYQPKSLQRFLF